MALPLNSLRLAAIVPYIKVAMQVDKSEGYKSQVSSMRHFALISCSPGPCPKVAIFTTSSLPLLGGGGEPLTHRNGNGLELVGSTKTHTHLFFQIWTRPAPDPLGLEKIGPRIDPMGLMGPQVLSGSRPLFRLKNFRNRFFIFFHIPR